MAGPAARSGLTQGGVSCTRISAAQITVCQQLFFQSISVDLWHTGGEMAVAPAWEARRRSWSMATSSLGGCGSFRFLRQDRPRISPSEEPEQ